MEDQDSVGIVIPVYRDVPVDLVDYIQEIGEALQPEEIIVEADSPSEELRGDVEMSDASLSVSETRRGKGRAIMDGFEKLETKKLCFADRDASIAVSSLQEMVENAEEGRLVISSRRHPDSEIHSHENFFQKIMGDFYARFTRFMLPVEVTDIQCGAKIIDSGDWDGIEDSISSEGFYWDTELIYAASQQGIEIYEVPIEWTDREDSSVSLLKTPLEFGIKTFLRGISHRVGKN